MTPGKARKAPKIAGASRSPVAKSLELDTRKRRAAGLAPLSAAEAREVFSRLRAANPHPRSELQYCNSFTLLVAVVLSAQATDAGVNKATRALFAVADSPAKMIVLGEERVREMIKTIGLYRGKAKNVIDLSQRLVDEQGGEVPHSRDYLESLPGVGRKTANVVLNVAFAEPTIAVDTHVFRVANRLPLAIAGTPIETERGLEKIVPEEFKLHAHHWLILHGRHVCKARRPECERCVISDLCRWPEKRV